MKASVAVAVAVQVGTAKAGEHGRIDRGRNMVAKNEVANALAREVHDFMNEDANVAVTAVLSALAAVAAEDAMLTAGGDIFFAGSKYFATVS